MPGLQADNWIMGEVSLDMGVPSHPIQTGGTGAIETSRSEVSVSDLEKTTEVLINYDLYQFPGVSNPETVIKQKEIRSFNKF